MAGRVSERERERVAQAGECESRCVFVPCLRSSIRGTEPESHPLAFDKIITCSRQEDGEQNDCCRRKWILNGQGTASTAYTHHLPDIAALCCSHFLASRFPLRCVTCVSSQARERVSLGAAGPILVVRPAGSGQQLHSIKGFSHRTRRT